MKEKRCLKPKKIIIGAAALLLAGFLVFLCIDLRREKYSVYGQFSFGGGDYRETVIHVVVRWTVDVDKVADEIIQEHMRVNAENQSDKITLKLYHSERAMKHGDCFKELLYVQ